MNLYHKNHTWRPAAKRYVIELMQEFGFNYANESSRHTLEFFNEEYETIRIGYPNGLGVIRLKIWEQGYTLGRLHAQAEIKKALGLQS